MAYVDWYGFKAEENNLPLARPGAYRVVNLARFPKCYVGISQNVRGRLRGYASGNATRKFQRALRKYGVENFLIVPICYSISGTDWLPYLEVDFIVEFDSIKNGYNIIAAYGGVGPYGKEFSESIREALNTPEIRARHLAAIHLPENLAKARVGFLGGKHTEEQKAHHRAVMKTKDSSHLHTPEVRAKAEKNRRKHFWITDGINELMHLASYPVPNGWREGRSVRISEASSRGVKNRQVRIWITDGTDESLVLPDSLVPDGWQKGRNDRSRQRWPVKE
jgi:hypothetical protein